MLRMENILLKILLQMKTLVVKSCSKLQKLIDRIEPKSLNFIPTMGNLHEGHFLLSEKLRKKED